MLLGIQEPMIPGASLKEKVRALEDLKLDGIELLGNTLWEREREVEEALGKSGIVVSTICSGYRGKLLSPDPKERETALNDLEKLLELGGRWKCNGLILVPRLFDKCMLPNLSPYITAKALEQNLFMSLMERLYEQAERYKCPIILEPLNRYLNDIVNTGESALGYVENFHSSYMGIMLDFFHMNIEEASMEKAIKTAQKYLLHIHLADSNRLWPGEGHIDWRSAAGCLRAVNFERFCVLECMVGVPTLDRLKISIEQLRACGF